MRENREFGERTTQSENKEVKQKVFLVYEGDKSEAIYFNGLNANKKSANINKLIELVPIVRSFNEEGWSNPKKILDHFLKHISEELSGQFSYESAIDYVVDYYISNKVHNTKVSNKIISDTLKDYCREKLHVELHQTNLELKDVIEKFVSHLSETFKLENLTDKVSEIISHGTITYDKDIDRICLIVDRDAKSFKAEKNNNQYDYVLNNCKKNNIDFYVSNPCFEFWLLLHFDEVCTIDKVKMLENKKSGKKTYAESELRKLVSYKKEKYDVNIFIARIDTAIKNADEFCCDINRLVSDLGSNLGVLLKMLKSGQ